MRVVVTYAREDIEPVRALVDDIAQFGHDVWIDELLRGGQEWWDEVLARIRQCDLYVFAITARSLNSDPCTEELRYADSLRRPLLPVKMGTVDDDFLPPILARAQFVDYREPTRQAVVALAAALATFGAADPLPSPLPDPPPIPQSQLYDLDVAVRSPVHLDRGEQLSLLDRLRIASRDPRRRSGARDLLQLFRQRFDIIGDIRDQSDEALAQLHEPDRVPHASRRRAPSDGDTHEDRSRREQEAIVRFLTTQQPFGPPDSDRLFGDGFTGTDILFDRANRIFAQAAPKGASYIVGRKGAGKTAFLFGSTLSTGCAVQGLRTSDVYSKFIATTRHLEEQLRSPLFADHVAQLWEAVFYNVAAFHVCRTGSFDDPEDDLQLLSEYIPEEIARKTDPTAIVEWFLAAVRSTADSCPPGTNVHELLGQLLPGRRRFSDAQLAVSRVMQHRSQPLAIVMDNLEDLHLRLDDVRGALQGLFRCVGQISGAGAKRDFQIRICLPSEPYDRIHLLSTNPSKDFRVGDVVPIYWSARELLHLAGARFELFLKFNHPIEHDHLRIKARRIGNSDDGVGLLRTALPSEIINGLGITEDPVGYLMRHTQLIPRHLIEILNGVFASKAQGSVPWQVTREAVIRGTRAAERVIVPSILGAYAGTYVEPQKTIRALANRLGIRFTTSNLHAAYNREGIRKSSGLDFDEFLELLLTIGAVGVFESETDRYYKALFQYTFSAPLTALEGSDDLCFHPLFTRYLHAQSLAQLRGRTKVTYPYGSDPSEDYRGDLGYE
jgi:hypothetical protein